MYVSRYGVITDYTITLPMACTRHYTAVAAPRNTNEMACGVSEPNYATLQFTVHNNSAESRYIYGVYWITVGY